ncbi:hypothetical protein [Mangrovimonas aestuarii]|uniref:hypothetical protein n=1 Tax=Mangrovimonas aestuarii TaxID=3018443 RepID=UPI002377D840|nr:hypothetical protein [Mangrovimonas aestuarii]
MENKSRQVGNSSEIFKIQGDWNKQSKALQDKYPKLTSYDLKYETGKEKDLFMRLGTKLDKNRNEVIAILKSNQDDCKKTS